MTWVKLDDHFPDHHKVVKVGALAAWLHVCALCYCARYLTDGIVPKPIVARLADIRKPTAEVAKLVAVGLWEDVGDHYRIHDYLDYQPSKAQVEQERSKKQAAGQAGGRASAQARAKARGEANGQAESKPVPVPQPVPLEDHSSPSSSRVDSAAPQPDDDGLESYFQTHGYDPADVAVVVSRCRLRSRFGEPVTDPVAWGTVWLNKLAKVRENVNGKTDSRAVIEGVEYAYGDGQWTPCDDEAPV